MMSGLNQVVPLRERRRVETTAEIKRAALDELATAGAGSMSLRGVARAMGMTVQSIYHYFDSRDALLTELVVDAHNDLADTVEAAVVASRGRPRWERRVGAELAYRDWAFAQRAPFVLIYGTPVPGFQLMADKRSQAAAYRLGFPFVEVVFDGWTPAQLAAVSRPEGMPDPTDETFDLPTGALAFFVGLRARMHGMVMLELLGHLHPLQDHGRLLQAAGARRTSDEIDRLQEQVGAG